MRSTLDGPALNVDEPIPDRTIVPASGVKSSRSFPMSVLLSALTLAILCPMLLFGTYSLAMQNKAARMSEREQMHVLALDLANSVDRELARQIMIAEMAAASRLLQNGDIEAFTKLTEDAASKAYGHFILIDRNHQQLVNTRARPGESLPRTSSPDAVDDVFASGKPAVGNLTFGAVAQANLYSVRVPVPVDGKTRYVLSYVPRNNIMLDVLRQNYVPDGWRTAIADANGRILARSQKHEEFYGKSASPDVWARVVGENGLLQTVDLEGYVSLTAYQRSALSDWTVFVWAPEAVLQAPAKASQRQFLIWAGFAIAASLLVGWAGGKLIQRQARHLVSAARAMATGQPVACRESIMQEANIVCEAMTAASHTIKDREVALRQSEEQMRDVMRELSHRSLNLLTVIELIARHSGRFAENSKDFIESFSNRIRGLARSHDLLIKTEWQTVLLEELVLAQLSGFDALKNGRFLVGGPELRLRPQAAQHLGMGLHELATNALKYGALSVPEGQISVRWFIVTDVNGDARLHFRWAETGGPSPKGKNSHGFGSVVTEQLVPAGLGGVARVEMLASGLVWELDAPLSQIAHCEEQISPQAAGPGFTKR